LALELSLQLRFCRGYQYNIRQRFKCHVGLGGGRAIAALLLAAQAASTYTVTNALQTPYESAGPASYYPIEVIAIAPY
jgi:hypothetical protein